MPLQLKKVNQRKLQEKQSIDDLWLTAQQCFADHDFVAAIARYAELVVSLSISKYAECKDLADAYWNLAMANIKRANQIAHVDAQRSELHYAQAVVQIREALITYPASEKADIKACCEKLVELGASKEEFENSVTEPSLVAEKPAVLLHWKKILLQRYQQEIANASLEPARTCTSIKPN